jgi:type I pantothenate kinase
VAAGKTTLAAQLAEAWRAEGKRVEIVSTDGFLLPNATLIAQNLLNRKGFPESYDAEAFARFLAAVKSGRPTSVPVYSHQTYDIVQDAPRVIAPAEIVIVEGINALQAGFTAGKLDAAVYLDASEADLFNWYYARGMRLREAARADPQSYFVRYLALSDAAWDQQLKAFWNDINLPNLRHHIAPSRTAADYVLLKNAEHKLAMTAAPKVETAKLSKAHHEHS